jgi:hypothetical protein
MNTSPRSDQDNVANIGSQVDLRRTPLEAGGERVNISRPDYREGIAIQPTQELTLSRQPRQEESARCFRYPPDPVLGAAEGLARTERTPRKKTRERRQLPPQETRDWMTPTETAFALGCSIATVHRLRRGMIPGIQPLPCSRYGRKFVFRNASIARWQDNNEKQGLA